MAAAKRNPVKRGASKSETVHLNGKTRPIRDSKGHFRGSEQIDLEEFEHEEVVVKEEVRELGLIESTTHVKTIPAKSPHARTGHLMIYRVYSKNAGQGSGYYFTIKKDTLSDTQLESVMTLYNPKTDIIALERAIKKYKSDTK